MLKYIWDVGVKAFLYTRREYNYLEFSFSIPINVFVLMGGDFWVIDCQQYQFLLLFFFQKGGSAYISCCHKLEKLLKLNFSLILLQNLMFPLLSNNWQTKFRPLSEKQQKKMSFFSIKICLLNHRKFDRMQKVVQKKQRKSYFIETKCFCKIWEI